MSSTYLKSSLQRTKYLHFNRLYSIQKSKFSSRGYPSSLFSSPFAASSGNRDLPVNTIIKFVPQQEAWIVERMGKFHRVLEGGLAILIPILDQITYVKVLKEVAVAVESQSAITADNVTLRLDGVLYYKILDPYKASYGIENAEYAITQLAQTAMRAEIGQMTLDKTLAERAVLNSRIVAAMNQASQEWGIQCLRYEASRFHIKDITPPDNVVAAMHQQVSAERKKRAEILESEGTRQAAINVAQGQKESQILESEATKQRQINNAEGEAKAILMRAQANADAIKVISEAILKGGPSGKEAISLNVAEKYIEAFSQIAKEGNTVVVPANISDVSSMITSALTVMKGVNGNPISSSSSIKLPSSSSEIKIM